MRAGRLLALKYGALLFFLLFEVPGDSLLQSLVKVRFGLVAEFFLGAGDVGEGVLDVALSWCAVDGLGRKAQLTGDGGVDVVEGVASAGADVEDAAGGDLAGRQGGGQGWAG